MSADQLATRILAEQSGISSENLRMGKISQQDFRQLARAAAELQSLPLYIDDTPGLTIAALAHARPPPQAAEGHRDGHRRLSPAAPGHRQELQREPRPGNLRDQPRAQAARQGIERAGDRPVAALAARSSSARTSARSCRTCGNRARSSRTRTSSCSSTARIITSPRASPRRPRTTTTSRSSRPTSNGNRTWAGSTASPS